MATFKLVSRLKSLSGLSITLFRIPFNKNNLLVNKTFFACFSSECTINDNNNFCPVVTYWLEL